MVAGALATFLLFADPRGLSLRAGTALLLWALSFPLTIAPMLSSGYTKDLRDLGWSAAVASMLSDLEEEYPFTAHKGIDWDALGRRYLPEVAVAEAAGDRGAYLHAVRRLVHSVPDGHVRFSAPDDELRRAAVGAGYGLALGDVDGEAGGVAVVSLLPHGPAAAGGVPWGARVLAWNGLPIDDALQGAPVHWAERPPSTPSGLRAEQLRFLPRAEAGATAQLTILVPGEDAPRTLTLTAEEDGLATLSPDEPHPRGRQAEEPVTYRLLTGPGGARFGYVRVSAMRFPSAAPSTLRRALADFRNEGVSGVIVDLRGNRGGSDFAVAPLVAPFHVEEALYHHVEAYDQRDRRFEPIPFNRADPFVPVITYRVRPTSQPYTGPVAVIVDGSTASAAEGMALLLSRLPHVTVVGATGTRGILGAGNSKRWNLPEGASVRILDGRSLDAAGRVQVDSDADLRGGVEPDVVVSRDLDAWRAHAMEGRDVVLEAALRLLAAGPAREQP